MKIIAKNRSRVAEYLAQQITLCGKSQRDIAALIGYENANVITMMKQGLTKVPITKVGPLARALDVDPAYFLRLVLSEYMPETWAAIEDALDGTILTRNERLVIEQYRRRTGNADPLPPRRSETPLPQFVIGQGPTELVGLPSLDEGAGEGVPICEGTASVPAEVSE